MVDMVNNLGVGSEALGGQMPSMKNGWIDVASNWNMFGGEGFRFVLGWARAPAPQPSQRVHQPQHGT